MKITVLSGSPKGELSVTLQYVKFIQRKFPKHELKIVHVSHDINKIEKDEKIFGKIIDEIKSSDGVLWAFPLYVLLVPSQYKRFIELIWERGAQTAFKNKYAAALTTSINFYDHTAHNYMRAICDDLDMRFVDSFSAEMDDLFMEGGRARLLAFAKNFFEVVYNKLPAVKIFAPLAYTKFCYTPGKAKGKVDTGGKRIVVLTDVQDEQSNLAKMVGRFKGTFSQDIEVYNLHDVNIKGGCLGCLQCGFENVCVYQGQDDFVDFFNIRLRDADITVFAGAIKDRYLSSRWKMYFDRSFFNGHIPVLMGKQMGFIISGPLSQIPNLRQIFEAEAEMSQANLADIITDECEDSSRLDALLHNFASKCVRLSAEGYIRPHTFLGVGGHKIFRDFIWAKARFPFLSDFKFYRKHGMFDFPQKDKRHLKYGKEMIDLIKTPEMREMVRKMIKTEMVKSYQRIAETA
ncbi:MAG: NAD(P)H-dependent oxidoreductase [Dehalococcoidia bacterium]|nr:NAD(P)H-dependent oxidoreductase [Dehalococcoidia bacterium]